jgi:hypothetical protein
LIKHKHADVIKAWADGASIEMFSKRHNKWIFTAAPTWNIESEYRVSPAELVWEARMEYRKDGLHALIYDKPNLRLYFDKETKELIKAEVLK